MPEINQIVSNDFILISWTIAFVAAGYFFKKLNKDINNNFTNIDKKFANMKKEITGKFVKVNKNIKKLKDETTKIERCINKQFDYLKRGMGTDLEKFNSSWVEMHIKELFEMDSINIINGKKFEDPNNIVNQKSKEFELDIYCENPLIIGECTTFLYSDEFDKVKKLTRVREYFGKPECLLFYFAYEISPDIEESVKEFCEKENIKLVVSKYV